MKKTISLIMALCFIVALFAGCGGNNAADPGSGGSATAQTTAQPTPTPSAKPDAGGTTEPTAEPTPEPTPVGRLAQGKVEYNDAGIPLSKYEYELPLTTEDVEFSLFTINYTPQYIPEGGMNDIPIWGNMGKMTGVHIEYIMSTAAACGEQFAVLLAADDIPDITAQGQSRYSGPLREAIEDGWFANIAEYRDFIPNYLFELNKASAQNPNSYEKVFLDKDTAAVFYDILKMPSNIGWCIREDIMDDLNLGKAADIRTVDQLHTVFTAMRANGEDDFYPMPLYYCFELSGGKLFSGYNTALFTFSIGYYKRIVDGHVQYCGSTDDDLAALTTLHQWYEEGLIDPNWSSYTGNNDLNSQLANSKLAYVQLTVDDCANRNAACVDPDCRFVPTPRLSLYEGQTLKWGLATNYLGDGSYVVSAKCSDVELAISWVDWHYSDFGCEYCSWGPEGELFYINEDGEKRLTDMILNNEAGTTWILQLYGASTMSEGGLIDNTRNYAIDGGKETMAMLSIWDVSDCYSGEYDWRDGITLSTDQNDVVQRLKGDLNTYYQENYSLFMIGDRPLTEWNDFVDTMMEMGLRETLEVYDEAYQDYLART